MYCLMDCKWGQDLVPAHSPVHGETFKREWKYDVINCPREILDASGTQRENWFSQWSWGKLRRYLCQIMKWVRVSRWLGQTAFLVREQQAVAWMKGWESPLVCVTVLLLRRQLCLRTGDGGRKGSSRTWLAPTLHVMWRTLDLHIWNRCRKCEIRRAGEGGLGKAQWP